MTTLDYMNREARKHRHNYARQSVRPGVTQSELACIMEKIKHYEAAVAALEEQERRKRDE